MILGNALASFTKRMSLILYQPLQEEELVIRHANPTEIALPTREVFQAVAPFIRDFETIPSTHGFETIFLMEKP